MNVIDMALQVSVVTNGVLPITTLPNPSLAAGDLADAARHVAGKPARKSALDQAPTQRKVGVVLWQRPHGMQVVRQHTNCDGLERVAFLNGRIDASESIDMPHQDVT